MTTKKELQLKFKAVHFAYCFGTEKTFKEEMIRLGKMIDELKGEN